MFTKSNLLATLLGFIVLFFSGWVFYDMIASSFFENHSTATGTAAMKEVPDMVLIALGCLVQAFVMAVLYGKWARGHHSAKEGFTFGAWIGVFLGFGVWLLNHGVMDIADMTARLADGVWNIVQYGLVGLVIGLTYQKFGKQDTA